MRFGNAFASLRTRIVVFFATLLVLVQGLAFLVVTTANNEIARDSISQELEVGERVFLRLFDQQRGQLEQSARLLASEFGFRQAVASADRATILSALGNHGARASASVMLLVSLDHMLLADTLHPAAPPELFKHSYLTAAAEASGQATGVVNIDGKLYQLVVVQVNAPTTIAWVGVGLAIDDKTAGDLKSLTTLDVSFLSQQAPQPWRLHASTLPDASRGALVSSAVNPPGGGTFGVSLDGQDYLARALSIETRDNTQVVAILHDSLVRGFAPFQRVSRAFLILAVLAVVLSVVGSIAIAQNITRPINALALVAQRIKAGDYTEKVSVAPTGEVNEISALKASFNHMLDGIARREKENLRLAFEDHLTRLPNRAMFHDRLTQALMLAKRHGQPIGVMMLDLDRFKYVNDTLGHPAGDAVLCEVAQRFRELLRESDTVARLGGDEFAILLPSGDPVRTGSLARKIQQALELPITVEGQPIDIGTSIGIVHSPQHGVDANTLLRRADIAMYAAKRAKSGFAIYDERLEENRQDHLTLLGELRRAIEQNELRLFYQPKFGFAKKDSSGMEALIRWQHPTRGLVSPVEFIPFAEQTGNIKMISRWVIDSAFAQCGVWEKAGHPLRISINISARDLLDKELVPYVAETLQKYAVTPALICVELTESALMEDPINATQTLKSLHDLGLKLSMDDYGTGYSSLAYIKDLSLDELKIDRTFVASMQNDPQSAAIVQSTIDLGHRLGMVVVAEGVESAQELLTLNDFGCDYAQGFHVARPMQASEIIAWLLTNHET